MNLRLMFSSWTAGPGCHDGLVIGAADIVTAFAEKAIGTRVTDTDAFFLVLAEAIKGHDWSLGKTPGQALLDLPGAIPYVSCGVGRRTTSPADYIPALHRGRVGLYLRRDKAATTRTLHVVTYTIQAYLDDPDMTSDEASRITRLGCTHVVVAVLAAAGEEPPQLSPWGFVHNLAGGNNDYEADKLTVENLIEQAGRIERYSEEWCTVADGEDNEAMSLLREAYAANPNGEALLPIDWFDRARRLVWGMDGPSKEES